MTTASFPPAADPAHLTTALREAGVLRDVLSEVTVLSARDTVVSHIIRLGLSYDGPAPDAPRTLILKLPHENFAKVLWEGGRHEVSFYRDVAPLMPRQLVPRCHDGGADEASVSGASAGISDRDLSDRDDMSGVATLAGGEAIASSLARQYASLCVDARLTQWSATLPPAMR